MARAAARSRRTEVEHVEDAGAQPVRRLTVGSAHDRVEADADTLAATALGISRSWAPPDVRRDALAGSFQVDAGLLDGLGSGRSLDPTTAQRMGAGFGTDLGGVRVHTDGGAATAARQLGARAFTKGNDVYFGEGEYQPGTPGGDHVLAHELAHVVQGGDDVHRYPAEALAGPIDWAGLTGQVKKPGEGVSGGVFILTSTEPGEVEQLVVKPVFGVSDLGETGEQLVAGDKILSLLGITTPTSRVVKKGSAEFGSLVGLCGPHHPKPPDNAPGAGNYRPLDEATSFVVMGKAPGKSLTTMISESGTESGARSLYDALFNHEFLYQLGQICVGDMLVGNNDRILSGKANIGNLMVDVAKGTTTVTAIDTTAGLGPFDAKSMLDFGSISVGLASWASRTQTKLVWDHAKGPTGTLDDFMVNVIGRLKDVPTEGGGQPLWEVMETTYFGNRGNFAGSFQMGWDEALLQIMNLLSSQDGKQSIKDVLDEGKGTDGERQLNYDGLKTNASYLVGRMGGGDHESSAKVAAGVGARKELKSVDPASFKLPKDLFWWTVAPSPAPEAFKASFEHPKTLPEADRITRVIPSNGKHDKYDPAVLDEIGQKVNATTAAIDEDGTKKRGVFNKKEKTRNSTHAGRFVAATYLLGAGSIRADAWSGPLRAAGKLLPTAMVGATPQQAAALLPIARAVASYTTDVAADMDAYQSSLTRAAADVRRIHGYDKRKDLAEKLTGINGFVTAGRKREDDQLKLLNLPEVIAQLEQLAKGNG